MECDPEIRANLRNRDIGSNPTRRQAARAECREGTFRNCEIILRHYKDQQEFRNLHQTAVSWRTATVTTGISNWQKRSVTSVPGKRVTDLWMLPIKGSARKRLWKQL